MSKAYSRVLLVTANVGSIFEEPDKMIPIWMQEFMEVITRLEPEFLAIHCQEVGGKNYEDTMQHVNKFIKLLLSSPEMQQFDRARVFLDEDFTAVEKFTALGSLYFVHHTLPPVEIFDFQDAKFVTLEGKEVLSGNIEHVRLKEKAKFAQEFFPDFVWSRKGFIRTRWNLCGTVFDLVNIHLIHDVSNVAAMDASPSPYCDFRVKALLHTINRFETDRYDKVPFFVFGDFNFRLDTNELVKRLTANSVEQRILGKKNDVSKVIFKQQDNGKVILTVGKKDFHHHEHNQLFSRHNAMTLQIYDKEPEACRSKLFEYNVTFPPSYPFSEDAEDGTSYMPTRCPGWCDRIMMSHDVVNLFHNENGFTSEYRMIGMHICMGDHKPIYLSLQLRHHATTVPPLGKNKSASQSTVSTSACRVASKPTSVSPLDKSPTKYTTTGVSVSKNRSLPFGSPTKSLSPTSPSKYVSQIATTPTKTTSPPAGSSTKNASSTIGSPISPPAEPTAVKQPTAVSPQDSSPTKQTGSSVHQTSQNGLQNKRIFRETSV